jgi:hypothetical protein
LSAINRISDRDSKARQLATISHHVPGVGGAERGAGAGGGLSTNRRACSAYHALLRRSGTVCRTVYAPWTLQRVGVQRWATRV